MLESYFQEIKQKRRRKLFFWFVVLVFATGLYFFFKWYYISFNWNFHAINFPNNSHQNSNELTSSWNELFSVNSFGIIHIKTLPQDSEILINKTKKYNSGEKFFTDYGNYSISISRDGYVSEESTFTIDKETNFYIDNANLLKNPDYQAFPKITDERIISLGNDKWINQTASGLIFYENNFSSGTLISTGSTVTHIGDGKFLSWKKIMEYNVLASRWVENRDPTVANFVATCQNISYKKWLFHCSDTTSAMSNAWKVFTGVISYGDNFLKFSNQIILGDFENANTTTFSLSGSENIWNIFIELADGWFTNSWGSLVALEKNLYNSSKWRKLFPHADVILFASKVWETNFYITQEGEKNFLIVENPNLQHKIRKIEFPNTELTDIRIYEKNGNFFIKTRSSLLFLYREWSKIHWIIDGKILAVGKTFSLYQTDTSIWMANWEDRNSQK